MASQYSTPNTKNIWIDTSRSPTFLISNLKTMKSESESESEKKMDFQKNNRKNSEKKMKRRRSKERKKKEMKSCLKSEMRKGGIRDNNEWPRYHFPNKMLKPRYNHINLGLFGWLIWVIAFWCFWYTCGKKVYWNACKII